MTAIPRFRVSSVTFEGETVAEDSAIAARVIASLLDGLEFTGRLKDTNSSQLDIFLESAIEDRLNALRWRLEAQPVYHGRSELKLPDVRADLLVALPTGSIRAVIEIEKANRKTIWFDFIKLWMFLESNQANAAILIVPEIYPHRSGEWHLYREACAYLRLLGDVAKVSAARIAAISIIGYSTEVWLDDVWQPWNRAALVRLKA